MLISISMAYDRDKAEYIVYDTLKSVSSHVARIWVHQPSEYDSKWEDDISDFFIRIVKAANHVKKTKKLKRSHLKEAFNDCFEMVVADCPIIYKSEKYAAMAKIDRQSRSAYQFAQHNLVPALCSISEQIVDIVLKNEYESCHGAAELIAQTTIQARNKCYKIEEQSK